MCLVGYSPWGHKESDITEWVGKAQHMDNIMSSANSEFYFFSKLDFLYIFSSLIAVNRTSKTTLNSGGKNGQPCLVSVLKGNACIFCSLRIMFSVCLSLIAFIMLIYTPFMPTFWSFYNNRCWIFQKHSLHLLRCSYGFVFQFVNMVYHIDWFAYTEECLHPLDKAYLIMINDHFCVWLDSIC